MPGTLVCRHHGGAAAQVMIKAQHFELQMALNVAAERHQAARGTPGAFDALGKWSHADRELKEYEAKMARLLELRAELRHLKAGLRDRNGTLTATSERAATGARSERRAP